MLWNAGQVAETWICQALKVNIETTYEYSEKCFHEKNTKTVLFGKNI